MSIDITFSPSSQSKNNSDVAVSNRSSPSNSHIRKIEDDIIKKFHQAALDHLKKTNNKTNKLLRSLNTVTNQWIYPVLYLC